MGMSTARAARAKEQEANDKMHAARAKEQEANDKMHAAYAKQQDEAAKAMQMSQEIESLQNKLTEEANRRKAEAETKNALLYESGQALWRIMSHLQATAIPCQTASHTEIQFGHPQLTADAVPRQPASTNFDM